MITKRSHHPIPLSRPDHAIHAIAPGTKCRPAHSIRHMQVGDASAAPQHAAAIYSICTASHDCAVPSLPCCIETSPEGDNKTCMEKPPSPPNRPTPYHPNGAPNSDLHPTTKRSAELDALERRVRVNSGRLLFYFFDLIIVLRLVGPFVHVLRDLREPRQEQRRCADARKLRLSRPGTMAWYLDFVARIGADDAGWSWGRLVL